MNCAEFLESFKTIYHGHLINKNSEDFMDHSFVLWNSDIQQFFTYQHVMEIKRMLLLEMKLNQVKMEDTNKYI